MTNPTTPADRIDETPVSGETLSCLIDGELDGGECARLLERVCADRETRRQWMLWHWAGDALRAPEVAGLQSERFLERVSAALAAEPTIVAPRARRERARLLLRLALPGAAAVAAGAMLAVIAVPQLRGTLPAPAQMASMPAAPPPEAVTAAPPPSAGDVQRLAVLEAYLAAHRELAGDSMLPRTAPYLRASVPAQR